MALALDPIDMRLLDDWQRDFPLVTRPFARIAEALDLTETDVLARLGRLTATGAISRIGATCRPNTAGASTLAAVAAPEWRLEEVAGIIAAEPGVNHSYLREHAWNVWFVATGPDRQAVDALLNRIRKASGLDVLDLPLVQPFNVDLGFSLSGRPATPGTRRTVDPQALQQCDRPILQALSTGLALVPRPFADLAETLGRSEADVLARIRALAEAGVLSRVGVIVRHRALGWTANAMVVFEVPEAEAAAVGPILAAVPGVTLCYQRRAAPGKWPYTLYCMVHARNRDEALTTLTRATHQAGLGGYRREILFSTRCFKQSGALIADRGAAA